MRVVALGRTKILLDTIRALIAGGHEVPLVVTARPSPRHTVHESDVETLARDIGAEYLYAPDINSPAVIRRLTAAVAPVAVSVDWPLLVGPEACGAFQYGILNAHGGDLPRFRGNAPVAWAILMGESRIGLTIHQMDAAEFDAGPIALKEYYPLSERTYIREVFDFIESRTPELFVCAVDRLAEGSLTLVPQSSQPGDVLRCFPRLPIDARIDWTAAARDVVRLVRASAEPFDGAFTYLRGQLLRVWRARAEVWPVATLAVPGHVVQRNRDTGEVRVASGRGVVVLEQVELEANGRCAPVDVIRSSRDRLGLDSGDYRLVQGWSR